MYKFKNRLSATDTERSRLEKSPTSQKQNPFQRKIASVMLAFTLIFTFSNCDKLRKIDFDELRKIDCNKEIGDIVPTDIWKYFATTKTPQQNLVITTPAEWDTLLNNVDSWTAQGLSRDSIDFFTQQVIAVFGELQGSGGAVWWTEIVEIKEYACHIVVTYHPWKFETHSGISIRNVQPFHVVKIPATNKPIAFQQKYDESPNVPYAICTAYPPLQDTTFLRAPAYLFVDSIPANRINDKNIMHIVYYPTQDLTEFRVAYQGIGWHPYSNWSYGRGICNFPDFAKTWNIPPQGKKVYCIGEFYDYHGGGGFTSSGYLVLTHLKDTVW